ncbi:OmpP1/FadL family transporter [Geothrix sp. PMB-07]|uniref:OmpP1/FadL family transporter n=1 Tax=Geothrix sp. PMB-07 TaxID=3068640 RepID=UPI0027422952|nr:outer membrane protein transport protein [Geothrix sp. PMB-07]WLT32896.1 outer membrane protein transport protein [Geothrix sp. PMB-07]
MAMGGAFTAIADDATAVSYNPAGLAQLIRPEVSVVTQGYSRGMDFTGFTGGNSGAATAFEDTSNSERAVSPGFASFSVPWKLNGRNIVFLLSYQKAFDFAYNSDVDYLASSNGGATSQAISQQVHQTGGVNVFSVALGAEVSHRMLLGVAVNSWQGRSTFSSFSQRTTSGVNLLFDSELSQESTFHGLNATLGLIWRSQWLNIGMTYRTPFRASYVFTNDYKYVDSVTGLIKQETGLATAAEIKWPETWTGGFGLHLGSRVLVTTDWSFTPWSHARLTGTGTSLDGSNWFDLERVSVTPKATTKRLGVEWLAWVSPRSVIPLRAGLFREPQPIVDTLTGAQRVTEGWTLGTGIKLKDLTLDVGLKATHEHRFISRFNTDAPIGGVASIAYGFERLREYRYYASCIYQFDTDSVHRAITWIFDGE